MCVRFEVPITRKTHVVVLCRSVETIQQNNAVASFKIFSANPLAYFE